MKRSLQSCFCACLFATAISAHIIPADAADVNRGRPDETSVQDRYKSRDLATIASWVVQLNSAVDDAASNSDAAKRSASATTCQRLIYGIEKLVRKLNVYDLTDQDKQRLTRILMQMSKTAKQKYEGDALRWRSQQADDLQFGEEQLNKMLKDRPQMNAYISKNDPIWKWTVRQFGGEGSETRVYWDPSENCHITAASSHTYERAYSENPLYFNRPFHEGHGFIRVKSASKDRNGEDLWNGAVFEFYNVQNTPSFQRVREEACAGKLDKAEYVRRVTLVEFDTSKLTALFYRRVWSPNMIQRKMKSREWDDLRMPKTFNECFAQFGRNDYYPWKIYGEQFTKVILPQIADTKRFNQSVQQAERSAEAWRKKQESDDELKAKENE